MHSSGSGDLRLVGTDAMLYGELGLPAATIAAFVFFIVATRPGPGRR
jgi:hypothetical protein